MYWHFSRDTDGDRGTGCAQRKSERIVLAQTRVREAVASLLKPAGGIRGRKERGKGSQTERADHTQHLEVETEGGT